jgi:transcriptional regulator with XRE-family HTH domain
MTTLSEKITAAVVGAGLTGRDLADRIGVHESTVSLWMSGGRTPRVKHLEKLAKALGKEVADFWTGPEAMPTTPEQAAMVDEMGQLTLTQQQALLAMARAMRGDQP